MRRKCIGFFVLFGLMMLGLSSTVVSQFGDPVPMYPQEMDGMVNMINRALVFSETDIAVPGRGLGIEFTRHYNSAVENLTYWRWYTIGNAHCSFIGVNWRHSYQWRLIGTLTLWLFRVKCGK